MDNADIPENYIEAVQAAINESLEKSNLVTKIDLKEFKDEMHYEMKCVERRMTLKIAVIVIGLLIFNMFNNRI